MDEKTKKYREKAYRNYILSIVMLAAFLTGVVVDGFMAMHLRAKIKWQTETVLPASYIEVYVPRDKAESEEQIEFWNGRIAAADQLLRACAALEYSEDHPIIELAEKEKNVAVYNKLYYMEQLEIFIENEEPEAQKYASENGLQVMTDGTEVDFKKIGVIRMGDFKYTYYSSNVLRHYKTHEWVACDDHIYRTEDGLIVVASVDFSKGSIVSTPFGLGIVLDSGCASGTIDIYTDF